MVERPSAVPWAALVGVGATLPWALVEAGLARGPWRAFVIASLLAAGWGVPFGLLLGRLRKAWLQRVVATALPLFAFAPTFDYSVGRAIDLWVPAKPYLGIVSAGVLAIAPFGSAWMVLRRKRLNRLRAWPFAAAALAVFFALLPHSAEHVRASFRLTAAMVACGVVGAICFGLGGRAMSGVAALGVGAAGCLVPPSYVPQQALLGCWTMGLGAVFLFETHRAAGTHPPASRRVRAMVTAGVLTTAAASLAGASWMLASGTSAWKNRPARGGYASFLLHTGRAMSDWDRDGHGIWLGHRDCDPWNAEVYPGAPEIPKNGRDDNCQLGDATDEPRAWLDRQLPRVAPPPPWRGDLILVVVDALRPDEATAPELGVLHKLLFEGVYYDRAYSTGTFTPEALLGALAARMASSVDFNWLTPFHGCPTEKVVGLPTALQERGYRTMLVGPPKDSDCFTSNSLGNGFDELALMPYFASAPTVVDRAISTWNIAAGKGPRFLYLHLLQAHNAYESRQAYREQLVQIDRELGRLLQVTGDTALWITMADHGEEFWERGTRGHAQTLYDEVSRVPLALRGPGLARGRITSTTSVLYLPETVLAMVDGAREPRAGILCTNPLEPACADQPAPIELRRPQVHLRGLVVGRSKLIRDVSSGWLVGYDLDQDPGERTPLTALPQAQLQAFHEWEEYGFSSRGSLSVEITRSSAGLRRARP